MNRNKNHVFPPGPEDLDSSELESLLQQAFDASTYDAPNADYIMNITEVLHRKQAEQPGHRPVDVEGAWSEFAANIGLSDPAFAEKPSASRARPRRFARRLFAAAAAVAALMAALVIPAFGQNGSQFFSQIGLTPRQVQMKRDHANVLAFVEGMRQAPVFPGNEISYEVGEFSSFLEGTMRGTLVDAYAVTNLYDAGLEMDKFVTPLAWAVVADEDSGRPVPYEDYFDEATGKLTGCKLVIVEIRLENIDARNSFAEEDIGEEYAYCFYGDTIGRLQAWDHAYQASENLDYISTAHEIDNDRLSGAFELKPGESKTVSFGYIVEDHKLDMLYLLNNAEGNRVVAHIAV